MKCRYYGELKLHDGSSVQITDKKVADKIDAEFQWLFKHATEKSTEFTIRAVQCLFALKLGDRYGWTTDRLSRLLKDVAADAGFINDGEMSIDDILEELKENYHIEMLEDGMIRVEHFMDDNIYDVGEWRPLSQRKPEDGFYLITTDRGAVCTAAWRGGKFSGSAGAHAVAWRELPEAYEFWRDEKEINDELERRSKK
jgi:hypothetical protein